MRETVEDSALTVINYLEQNRGKGEINVHTYVSLIDILSNKCLRVFQEYTLDIIFKVALGKKEVEMFNNKYLDLLKDIFNR